MGFQRTSETGTILKENFIITLLVKY